MKEKRKSKVNVCAAETRNPVSFVGGVYCNMKILIISPTPTFPADQGNRQRVKRLCQALKQRGAEIHFGYFPREWGGRFSAREQQKMTAEWDFYDTIVPSKPFVYQTEERYFGIDDWWDDAIGRFIRYKVDGESFDACIVNYAFFSKALEYLPNDVVKILDTHDRLSGRREMLEAFGVEPEFFYTTEDQERIALQRADIVLAINEEEAEFFRKLSGRPVITLGHVAEAERAVPVPRAEGERVRMGFLGSSNSVNVKNMNDFLVELTQRVPEGLSGIQIDIYGSVCSRINIPDGCRTPVRLLGRVDEVSDFYANVDCAFVPFLFGTGQKIKLIEALSYGVPLLATANASEGSGSIASAHLLSSFEEVIDAMTRFAQDSAFREQLAADTVEQFDRYCARIDDSLDAVYGLAGLNTLSLRIDCAAVQDALSGWARRDILSMVVRCTSVIDMLNWIWRPEGKKEASDALRRGVANAIAQEPNTDIDEALQPVTWAQILFDGLEGDAPLSAQAEVRFRLPGIELTGLLGSHGSCLRLPMDSVPQPARSHILPVSTICTPRYTTTSRARQVVILADTLDNPALAAIARQINAGFWLRRGTNMPLVAIDLDGRHARWSGGSFDVSADLPEPFDVLSKMRGIVLSEPALALAVGFTHLTAAPLHRVLINDCGLLISLVDGPALSTDGEILARGPDEVAALIAQADSAPAWAAEMELRRRRSVDAREGLMTIAGHIQDFLKIQRAKWMHSAIDALHRRQIGQDHDRSKDAA